MRRVAPDLCRSVAAEMIAGLALGFITPASAQIYRPAVSCEVADFSMTLHLYMPLAYDKSGSPGDAGMEGSLEIHHQKVPKERRIWSLDGKRPVQFWNRDGDLKIMLVLGGGEEAIHLVIDTRQRRGEDEFVGAFRLTTPEVSLSGRLACQAG